MRPLTSQLGHVIERFVESDKWAERVKKRQFLTFLPVRSSRTDHRHPDHVNKLDIGKFKKKKMPHFNKQLAQGCSKLKSSNLEVLGLFARDSSLCDQTIHSSAKMLASLNTGASGLQANQK